MRRPPVRRSLLGASGLACALLAARFLFCPIYFSTLAPPLPQDAVKILSPVPTIPFADATAAPRAALASVDTQNADNAEKSFPEACNFYNTFPDQYDLAIEKFNAIAEAYPGTKWETDARSRASEIVAAREEVMTRTFESVSRDANTLVEWGDYPAALRLYESFLSTFPWTKFRDAISVETSRIKKIAAMKTTILAQRADHYLEKGLLDLARVELERILELAVDKESI